MRLADTTDCLPRRAAPPACCICRLQHARARCIWFLPSHSRSPNILRPLFAEKCGFVGGFDSIRHRGAKSGSPYLFSQRRCRSYVHRERKPPVQARPWPCGLCSGSFEHFKEAITRLLYCIVAWNGRCAMVVNDGQRRARGRHTYHTPICCNVCRSRNETVPAAAIKGSRGGRPRQ